MSIISEALKKAQEEQKKEFKKQDIISEPTVKSAKPRTKIRKILFMLFGVMLITASALVAYNLITGFPKDLSISLPTIKDYKIPEPSKIQIDTESLKKQEPKRIPLIEKSLFSGGARSFELSGIVFGAGNPYAVINNQILEEGDKIGGAEIIKIEKDRVTLLSGDDEIVLNLEK